MNSQAEQVTLSVSRSLAVAYTDVASLTVLLFDFLLNIESEVSYIWAEKMSVVKVLYLLSRYPAFIDVPLSVYYDFAPHNVSHRLCFSISVINACGIVEGISVTEAILMIRTYALWGVKRKILIFIMSVYIAILFPVIVILVIHLRSLIWDNVPTPAGVLGCRETSTTTILFVDFLLLMFYEALLMSLTLWVGVKKYRHSRNPLILVLYRDGILYFVYVFLITIANILTLTLAPSELAFLMLNLLRVLHTVFSTRMILHIRSHGRKSSVNLADGEVE